MTTDTAEKTETQSSNVEASQEDLEKAIAFVANDLLSKATLLDLCAGAPLNTLIQNLQNQSIARAKQAVGNLTQEQLDDLLVKANTSEDSAAAE
jgi:hypothetical protein|tara:strand:+ start:4706 stop:4987 length:282 start_codon:yes stop_codon:yes gene_type:complete